MLVSYLYGPVHHTQEKTVWEVGYKKKREKFSAQKFLLCFCLRVYQNLNACPFKSMLKILVLNQGKKWFQMQTWLLTSNKWKRLIWICSQYIEEILELVLSMMARKYFRIWVLRIISLGRIEMWHAFPCDKCISVTTEMMTFYFKHSSKHESCM